jgi:hypothetical protein
MPTCSLCKEEITTFEADKNGGICDICDENRDDWRDYNPIGDNRDQLRDYHRPSQVAAGEDVVNDWEEEEVDEDEEDEDEEHEQDDPDDDSTY